MVLDNWAPIIDFKLASMDGAGHQSIIATSGTNPAGAIREITKTVKTTVASSSAPDYSGLTGIWTLPAVPDAEYHSFMVLSFGNETRVMHMFDGVLDDVSESSGFDLRVKTIFAGNLDTDGFLVQVHRDAVVVAFPSIFSGTGVGELMPYFGRIYFSCSIHVLMLKYVFSSSASKVEAAKQRYHCSCECIWITDICFTICPK
jgi:hypothetical protein